MSNTVNGVGGANIHHVGKADGQSSGGTAAEQSSQTTGAQSGGEQVALSDTAQRLQEVERSLASGPEIDHAKVTRIKEEIAQGAYQDDAQRIADKLIDIDKKLP